jgi:hypothetical protein
LAVADRAISNLLVSSRVINVVQPKSDPVITSTCIARASREIQFDAQQRGAARVRELKRREQKLDDPLKNSKSYSN